MAPPDATALTKTCRGCNRELSLDDFSPRPDTRDGRRSKCHECLRAYSKELKAGRKPWTNIDHFEADESLLAAVEAGGEALWTFGTPIQRASAETLVRCGGLVEAALELQLEPRQLRAHLNELQRRAASRGYAPGSDMTTPTPEGYGVKGVSNFFRVDPDTGEKRLVGQWIKTKKDEEDKIQRALDAIATISDRITLAEPAPLPQYSDEDLLVAYPLGDPHLGMFSWEPETGNNFDLKIAEQTLYAAVDHLVELAPPARYALIANLGDFFHADNRGNTTTAGTPVDSDGRWPKVLSAGIKLTRRLIDRALLKHEHVHYIAEIGNHDWHGSLMLAMAVSLCFENEPRVTVDTSPAKFHWYRFGKNLIATTHGDTVKLLALGEVMASDRPQDWGETLHRYWLTGHVHHDQVKELRGCTVESFRTLAPADAWHRGQGYRSGRDMKALTFHREHGQIGRKVVGIDELMSIAMKNAA